MQPFSDCIFHFSYVFIESFGIFLYFHLYKVLAE